MADVFDQLSVSALARRQGCSHHRLNLLHSPLKSGRVNVTWFMSQTSPPTCGLCSVQKSQRLSDNSFKKKTHIQNPGKWCTSQSCLWDPWKLSYHWGKTFCAIWYQVFLSRSIIWAVRPTKGDHQLHNDQKITKQPEKIPNSLQTKRLCFDTISELVLQLWGFKLELSSRVSTVTWSLCQKHTRRQSSPFSNTRCMFHS